MKTKTWSEITMEELLALGKENWTESDWETYHYIMQLRFESNYYSED